MCTVILFVRMWVEMLQRQLLDMEISRHPLREDVSWNNELKKVFSDFASHPLREDVSWNVCFKPVVVQNLVILFVRMWVEILFHPIKNNQYKCHPLREDVSWNTIVDTSLITFSVILFVRMWVEIFKEIKKGSWSRASSSSWGCELKYICSNTCMHLQCHPLREDVSWNAIMWLTIKWLLVILFVRMWVEIFPEPPYETREVVILFVRMWVEITQTIHT